MSKSVLVVEFIRGATHDGPGMRTTVFTKGCPLACNWCQNPESINPNQENWYDVKKCIGCLECMACPNNALKSSEDGIKILRDKCVACGICTDICPAKALVPVGTRWSVDNLIHEVCKDELYYNEFGGGVTVSGGEPLIHADFLVEFFGKLREKGINTALDTSGFISEEAIKKVLPFVDTVLYDLKLMDDGAHKKLTGHSNEQILENVKLIASYIRDALWEKNRKIQLWIRTPLIPGSTDSDENIKKIADFISENLLDVMERWELCAFNSACMIKYRKMQLSWPYAGMKSINQNQAEVFSEIALSSGIPEEKFNITGIIVNYEF